MRRPRCALPLVDRLAIKCLDNLAGGQPTFAVLVFKLATCISSQHVRLGLGQTCPWLAREARSVYIGRAAIFGYLKRLLGCRRDGYRPKAWSDSRPRPCDAYPEVLSARLRGSTVAGQPLSLYAPKATRNGHVEVPAAMAPAPSKPAILGSCDRFPHLLRTTTSVPLSCRGCHAGPMACSHPTALRSVTLTQTCYEWQLTCRSAAAAPQPASTSRV